VAILENKNCECHDGLGSWVL